MMEQLKQKVTRAKTMLAKKLESVRVGLSMGIVSLASGAATARVRGGLQRRAAQAGISTTAQEIAFVIAALVLVAGVMAWVITHGVPWENHSLGTVSNVTPTGSVPAANLNG